MFSAFSSDFPVEPKTTYVLVVRRPLHIGAHHVRLAAETQAMLGVFQSTSDMDPVRTFCLLSTF